MSARTDVVALTPPRQPFAIRPPIPGSKSITNRALLCAALADGTTTIEGALVSEDSEAMLGCVRALGLEATGFVDATATVTGAGGVLAAGAVDLDARESGTTSRFVLPVLGLGPAGSTFGLDGRPSLRRRPMGDVFGFLRDQGVGVIEGGEPGCLPVRVESAGGLAGGDVTVPADRTSQFVSALMLVGPCTEKGLRLALTGTIASRPYLDLTATVMAAFGATARWDGDRTIVVEPTGYRPVDRYRVEPDASSASYLLAAAALTAGASTTVDGLGTASPQGDARFVDVLEQMGARVDRTADRLTVTGTGALHGIDVDLRPSPDMAQTVAALAPFADGPTTVRGVDIIRGHETDRIEAVASELRRAGITVDVRDDGWTIHPGAVRPARIETYDDHRMAMAFALLGLRADGITIADPGCVTKTFPTFWSVLETTGTGVERRPHDGE
jgi:3-phosphoshikimate 1-carboxyvinyltransferase